ncbi:MAG: hypothetical protein EOM66_07960 [Clostridia bacterium]|nr:hypothetical protein [Clostridia bacterium]
MNAKQRIILLIASACVLALAFVLWNGLSGQHPNEPLAAMLRTRGYTVEAEQLYNAGSFEGQSIGQALSGVNLEDAVAASMAGGFPSDVNKTGNVTLLLCALGNQDVITLFVLDGEAELCFIQPLLGGALKPLDKEAAP